MKRRNLANRVPRVRYRAPQPATRQHYDKGNTFYYASVGAKACNFVAKCLELLYNSYTLYKLDYVFAQVGAKKVKKFCSYVIYLSVYAWFY